SREAAAIDHVAAVARQGDAVAGLEISAARLRVLSGEPADADHGLLQADEHHERHLQQNLELLHYVLGRALVEALRAIAALQQEGVSALSGRELLLQRLDLPGRDDRRERGEAPQRGLEARAVLVRRLLGCGPALPAGRVPLGRPLCHGRQLYRGPARKRRCTERVLSSSTCFLGFTLFAAERRPCLLSSRSSQGGPRSPRSRTKAPRARGGLCC